MSYVSHVPTTDANLNDMSAEKFFLRAVQNTFSIDRENTEARERKKQSDIYLDELASRHFRIIAKRCHYWHHYLSPSTRNFYDVDDMIAEVVMHVVSRSHRHNSSRGRESTMVWHVADNKCKTIIGRYLYPKRAGESVELTPAVMLRLVSHDPPYLLAREAVERVIQTGSDGVREIVDHIFRGKFVDFPQERFEEVRRTADRCAATKEDFRLVLSHFMTAQHARV